jgi:hypothetical protein
MHDLEISYSYTTVVHPTKGRSTKSKAFSKNESMAEGLENESEEQEPFLPILEEKLMMWWQVERHSHH